MLKANTCRYFNGLVNDTCDAGIAYDSIRVESGIADPPMNHYVYPCLPIRTMGVESVSDEVVAERNQKCASCSYPSDEEEAIDRERIEKKLLELTAKIANNICPYHDQPIKKVQVGRCVYADPCGCRLYQGKV